MSVSIVAAADQTIPLPLTIEQEGVGGVTGKSPTVALRDGATLNSYLDWNDLTFKTGGWTTKYTTMSEVERGHYQQDLDLSAIGAVIGNIFVAEYHVDDGGVVKGDAIDVVVVGQDTLVSWQQIADDTSLIRKAITNRQEEYPGTPGRLILYDDDGSTKILEQELRDNAGGGIAVAINVPTRRTSNILP